MMGHFVKLTQHGLPVLINPERVAFVTAHSLDEAHGSEIHFSAADGDFIRVSETLTQVIAALSE